VAGAQGVPVPASCVAIPVQGRAPSPGASRPPPGGGSRGCWARPRSVMSLWRELSALRPLSECATRAEKASSKALVPPEPPAKSTPRPRASSADGAAPRGAAGKRLASHSLLVTSEGSMARWSSFSSQCSRGV